MISPHKFYQNSINNQKKNGKGGNNETGGDSLKKKKKICTALTLLSLKLSKG